MNKPRVNEQLKEYYGQKSMSADTVARIRANAMAAATAAKRRSRFGGVWAIAAAVIVAFVAGVVFIQQTKSVATPGQVAEGPASDDPTMMIANRLVDRHENCPTMQFTGDSLAEVLDQMTELGFKPVLPDDTQLEGARIVSAHYCDVGGMRALHAFFIDANGERLSLFEAPMAPDGRMAKSDMTLDVGGYLVTLTTRNGLMVAFTRAAV